MKITVRITPNAKKSEILGWEDGFLKIKIAAPAIEGKANAELTRFLAKLCRVSKSQIIILKGDNARIKILDVPEDALTHVISSSSSSSPE